MSQKGDDCFDYIYIVDVDGRFLFAVYMQKRKNNKQNEKGYRMTFAAIVLLLGIIASTGG
ncbi:hypothetical protein QF033_000210 [Bacillus pumilus]|uniref:hypothetical protein n=1 Tax=Bacillus TaxID=1386 RepID=UPI002786CFBF|nr:hypothetical protein [Bacillus pumilus]MDQ0815632.1 hypothetical protein [Bacillus pumilus]